MGNFEFEFLDSKEYLGSFSTPLFSGPQHFRSNHIAFKLFVHRLLIGESTPRVISYKFVT